MTIPSRAIAPAISTDTVTRGVCALRTHALTLEQTDLLAAVITRMGVAVCQTRISQRNWIGLEQYVALDKAAAFYDAPDSPAMAYLDLLGTVKP